MPLWSQEKTWLSNEVVLCTSFCITNIAHGGLKRIVSDSSRFILVTNWCFFTLFVCVSCYCIRIIWSLNLIVFSSLYPSSFVNTSCFIWHYISGFLWFISVLLSCLYFSLKNASSVFPINLLSTAFCEFSFKAHALRVELRQKTGRYALT